MPNFYKNRLRVSELQDPPPNGVSYTYCSLPLQQCQQYRAPHVRVRMENEQNDSDVFNVFFLIYRHLGMFPITCVVTIDATI